jgi:outer membrane protein assembly factor BamB
MNQKSNIPQPQTSPVGRDREGAIRLSINIAIIAAVFSVLMSLLMLFNYYKLTTNDPIESETLNALVERLNTDQQNEQLLNEIRAFDLMARKAYFTSKWQIEAGAVLLILGAIIFVLALRYYIKATSKIDRPEADTVTGQMARVLASKWLLGIGLLFVLLAVGASFLSVDYFEQYRTNTLAAEAQEEEPVSDGIEVVDLTLPSDSTVDEAIPTDSVLIEPETTIVLKVPTLAEIKKQSNSFRGPLGNGVSFSKNIPTTWNTAAGTNIKWKVKIPKKGYNSPVIWGDKLFISGADNTERWLYCYDRKTGKLLWQHQANNIAGSPATAPKTTDDTGLAAPSVVTDGNIVVAIFGTGDIMACDFSGNRLWARNLGVPANHYGHSSSLVYWKEKVFVQYDTSRGSRLLAVDISTGKTVWETPRTSRISWASPILAEVGGKMQVITSSEPTVAGYDVETGKELWKNDCMMGEVGPSPAFGNGLVFATNEYATLAAIDPTNGKTVWQENEYMPEVASPVVSDGLLFIATSYSVLACYDAHTGNKYWEQEPGDGFYASPVIVEGKLFAIDMQGTVHIYKVSRQAEKIASVSMGEKVMSTPAFSDGCIYIRGLENLYCISLP